MLLATDFFDLDGLDHAEVFVPGEGVWTALDRLGDYLAGFFVEAWPLAGTTGLIEKAMAIHEGRIVADVQVKPTGPKGAMQAFNEGQLLEGAAVIMAGAFLFDDRLILGSGTVVEPGALVKGPTVVGDRSEIRQGAYVRGNCLAGHGCVIGHTTEVKNAILLDGAKAGHFAYIGDSILGRDVNLGAGTKLANLRMIPGNVSVRHDGQRVDTGRRKIGAVLGDRIETGCNSVTSPGTFIGPDSFVYPTAAVPGGSYPKRSMFKTPKPIIRSSPSR